MPSFDATVRLNGRITIPEATRNLLGINEGDIVHVTVEVPDDE